eukprot:NODE_4048_length_847_cov_10.917293_g3354_i0.p2 GENE.NODE_4048_length_847_cov_10.917293_g3354_i0~~NODE_4048_length_847_cov_10.917293_g3354_i0.p2  ORF type:complete len:69 (-),score=4.25 NODE_4048_length_847_cov_10.917293_g3354_i0:378-584(-)
MRLEELLAGVCGVPCLVRGLRAPDQTGYTADPCQQAGRLAGGLERPPDTGLDPCLERILQKGLRRTLL